MAAASPIPIWNDPVERVAVSVVIPALDEAHQIRRAIESVDWADEIIVVDGGSTDATASVARSAGARVMVVKGTTIGAQRNAGIAAARNAWVLALDADEQVTSELRAEIDQITQAPAPPSGAYRVRSRNWYLGRELRHGTWGRDWKVRVFTRTYRYNHNRVHEHLESLGTLGTLDGTLIHEPYRDLSHHVTKIVKYARWGAEDLRGRGYRATVVDVAVRPAWRFTRDYVFYGGWRDGAFGFVVSALNAFAAFLKYAVLMTMP